MSQKIKHSKIKNTGLLFEILTRQVTADILDGRESKSVNLLKKYFNENTALGKEKELYDILMTNSYKDEVRAEKLLEVVVKSRQRISNQELKKEKYNLIKEISDTFSAKDFFNTRVSNYKTLASIYKFFLVETTKIDFNPKQVVDTRYTILESITSKPIKEKPSRISETLRKEERDTQLLSYEILVDKFNEKYSNLSESQKSLLKEYINNVSNSNSFGKFINEEITKVVNELKPLLKKVNDKVVKIKLSEAINQAKNFTTKSIVRDNQVVTLMRYYELIKELKDVTKIKTT
tara:strand:+ start:660 stop:1532 length:873 start_codon:yes stop_codon:yes gene_type:complete